MKSKKTVLYEKHLALGASGHMADFAGYIMPLWYTSISSEHQAVRYNAGLFDCTHMGIIEFSGSDSEKFLNILTTNDVTLLNTGQGQYSYILGIEGNVLDDVIIYKFTKDRFMMVINAANESKIEGWLRSITNEKIIINLKPEIINLKSEKAGNRQLVDIALQGPASIEFLKALGNDDILQLKPFRFIDTEITGIKVLASRTGYTGSKAGFEFYVHPQQTNSLWDVILNRGAVLGIKPCGLGARDSLRTEAGLPLYGHELAGKLNICPFEAGYGWAVKLNKGSFIGKEAMISKQQACSGQVIRMQFSGKSGIRPLRQDDGIIKGGICVGWILSCAKVDDKQIVLAYIKQEKLTSGQQVGAYYLARSPSQITKGRKEVLELREKLEIDIEGEVVKRFEKF